MGQDGRKGRERAGKGRLGTGKTNLILLKRTKEDKIVLHKRTEKGYFHPFSVLFF